MLIDVILPVYNGKQYVINAVESVREQTFRDWRLYIVDDASTDETLSILKKRYAAERRINIIALPENRRTAGARMAAIARGTGIYLAFIDQDDVWFPEKLAREMRAIRSADVSAVHTDCVHIDAYGYEIPRGAERENRRRSWTDYTAETDSLVRTLYSASSVRIVSALVERGAFDAAGGFDTVNYGIEEWEFWIRFAAEGNKLAYINEPLFAHRDHANNASKIYALERLRTVLHNADILARDYGIEGVIVQRTKIWALRNIVINGLMQGRGAEVQQEIDALIRAGKPWAYFLRVLSLMPGYRAISNAGVKLALTLSPAFGA